VQYKETKICPKKDTNAHIVDQGLNGKIVVGVQTKAEATQVNEKEENTVGKNNPQHTTTSYK
jgi:hypothetical protein